MIGGLMKTTSRFAIVAAATLFAGNAYAADLGGNCCTDLEERVAELEATTVRKGNRKVSLTVSGQVNEAVIFWDDGFENNAYVVTNNMSRTRFRFVGDAKINADWKTGYLLEIGVRYANSGNRTQLTPNAGGESNSIDIRHSAWWLENKQLGRIWVGETSSASDGITEINLANAITAGNDPSAWGGGYFLRKADNTLSALRWNNITPSFAGSWAMDGDRNNIVRYVSPTFQGFTVSAAWGEDDMWDVALRYANEFNGVRVAAGIGYKQHSDNVGKSGADGIICADTLSGVTGVSGVDCNTLGLSGAIMHVPTGLYVHASWSRTEDKNRDVVFGYNVKDEDRHWYIQGGIERNFFGIGKSTFYGEYGNYETGAALSSTGGVASNAASAASAINVAAGGIGGPAANDRIGSADATQWGFGFIQGVDAAAMDLYIAYKHFEADVVTTTATGTGAVTVSPKDWDAVVMGAIIRF